MIVYNDVIFKSYQHREKGQGKRVVGNKTIDYSYGESVKVIGEYVDSDDKLRPIILKTNSMSFEKIFELVKTLKPYDKINCEINFIPYEDKCTFYLINAKKV